MNDTVLGAHNGIYAAHHALGRARYTPQAPLLVFWHLLIVRHTLRPFFLAFLGASFFISFLFLPDKKSSKAGSHPSLRGAWSRFVFHQTLRIVHKPDTTSPPFLIFYENQSTYPLHRTLMPSDYTHPAAGAGAGSGGMVCASTSSPPPRA
jgi:hypothetical protein